MNGNGKRNRKRKKSHIAKAPKSIINPRLADFCLSGEGKGHVKLVVTALFL
jgi:hypothetical protein